MAKILQSVTGAFTHVSHDAPKITQPKPILLAVSSAAPDLPDHKSGYFWSELLHPYESFSSAGFDCQIVSETGSATVDEASVGALASGGDKAKFDDGQFPLHTKLAQIKRADHIGDTSQYAAIFFAGGHGCCVDFPTAQNLQRLAAGIYERGGIVGAVCHGVAIFAGLELSDGSKLIAGKQATGFSQKGEEAMNLMEWMRKNNHQTMESIIRSSGGEWSESSNPMGEYTRADERVITGMNPASAKAVADKMIEAIKQGEGSDSKGEKAAATRASSAATASSSKAPGAGVDSELDKQSKSYSGERSAVV